MVKFNNLYERQKEFQSIVTEIKLEDLPMDHVKWYQYHITASIEELGEILKADKRWKTHRNTNYEPEEKLEEIADLFITCINLSMFSGFGQDDILGAIQKKINKNFERIKKEQNINE